MARQKINEHYYVTVVPNTHKPWRYDAHVHSAYGVVASENDYETEGEAMRAGVREGQKIAGFGTVGSANRARSSRRSRAPKTMIVENVQYHRYKIRFRWSDGRVVQWIRYAPAEIYMRESFERELAAKDITPDLLMPGSATIRRA
jgi:hypothetical protein